MPNFFDRNNYDFDTYNTLLKYVQLIRGQYAIFFDCNNYGFDTYNTLLKMVYHCSIIKKLIRLQYV